MPGRHQKKREREEPRYKWTGRVYLKAYDALPEIQRLYRRKKGKRVPQWRIVSTAILNYAKKLGVRIGE